MNKFSQGLWGHLALRLALLAVFCLAASLISSQLPDFSAFNRQWLDSQNQLGRQQATVNYLWVATLLLSIGLPRQLAAFLGGYAFGFSQGLLLSMLAVTISCLLTLAMARWFGRPLANWFFASKIARLDQFMRPQPFQKAVLLRLFPVGNNLVTNIVAGLTAVPAGHFVLGSVVGYLPQMVVFSLMGKGVLLQSGWKIVLSLLLFALSSLLSWRLYQQHRRRESSSTAAGHSLTGSC